jgi:hypothetical protein
MCLGSAAHAVSWFGAIAGGYVASSLHVRNDSVGRIAETLKWLGAKLVVHDAAFTSLIHAAVQE